MYRDFIYLDTGRIQSIIAQLEQGVLDKVMEGKSSELEGKASLAAGVLASFLPVGIEGGVARRHEVQSSKVLHDYAFNLALNTLGDNDLYLEVDDWDTEYLSIPNTAFILVRGDVSIIDYALLKNLAENETILGYLSQSSSNQQYQPTQAGRKGSSQRRKQKSKTTTGPIQEIWLLVDALMGDSVQVRLKIPNDTIFAGPLTREYLRENTRDLIFKYGGKPQEGWAMLAQISQITEPLDKIKAMSNLTENLSNLEMDEVSTFSDMINPMVELLNVFQEAMASVSYPAVAVTPIALYRELDGLNFD